MVTPSCRDTALHYCVDDLPGATIPGSRLQHILERLRLCRPLTRLGLEFLRQQGLDALHRLATDALPYDRFRKVLVAEQTYRIETATAARLVREAEERACDAAMQTKLKLAREQAEASRRARESAPQYLTKLKNQQLRSHYGIDGYVEEHCFGRLINILKKIDAGERASPEEFVWLSSVGKDYFSNQLRAAYHRLEAEFFANEFRRTRDPWQAVSASGHYRKCSRARDANALLGTINVDQQKSSKLKAALSTTHGGVMRDLGHWDEALRLGEKGHALQADDYRPCTLLGAVHMETGNYALGQEWYAKAVERGATVDAVDQDLRRIFFRSDAARQAEMSAFLLNKNSFRYAWVAHSAKYEKGALSSKSMRPSHRSRPN